VGDVGGGGSTCGAGRGHSCGFPLNTRRPRAACCGDARHRRCAASRAASPAQGPGPIRVCGSGVDLRACLWSSSESLPSLVLHPASCTEERCDSNQTNQNPIATATTQPASRSLRSWYTHSTRGASPGCSRWRAAASCPMLRAPMRAVSARNNIAVM
jgi:hypothetical protein